jgi:hypothetical protein
MSTESWVDKGSYLESTTLQGSEDWKKIRDQLVDNVPLITGSQFGNASGVGYETCEQLCLHLLKIKKREFDKQSYERMQHGTEMERVARGWYEHVTKNKVTDAGFAIPKFDNRIGASLDGHVGDDGCIEIKCPQSMYLVDEINPSHFAQMQGGMAITNKKWCDYVVYSTSDGYASITRVEFDLEFWEKSLYPKLCNFIEYMKQVKQLYGI